MIKGQVMRLARAMIKGRAMRLARAALQYAQRLSYSLLQAALVSVWPAAHILVQVLYQLVQVLRSDVTSGQLADVMARQGVF